MDTIPILLLSNTEACRAALVGNKAANLAMLLGAGFPVPLGFVITIDALQACAGKEMEPDLEASILAAYRELAEEGHQAVAVRSSATSEDLPGHSFAGQYETVLDVRSEPELLEAIWRCRRSLDSDRAMAYRGKSGIPGGKGAMAVLVQKMSPAEVSGVLFTVNPLTRDPGEMVINAGKGLGEALVSGRITPDEYLVDGGSGVVRARLAGAAPLLLENQIHELCEVSKRIERLFGCPQDIEWCWGEGRFHILQSRPITTLAPLIQVEWGHPANEALSRQQVVFWSNWNTRENMPYPLKPLAWSFFSDVVVPEMMGSLLGIHPSSPLYPYNYIIDLVNGRAYWNMSLLLGHPFISPMIKGKLKLIDHEAGEAFERLAASGEFKPFKLPVRKRDMLGPSFRGLWTFIHFPWLASPRALQRRSAVFWKQASDYENTPLEGRSFQDLLEEVRRFARIASRFSFPLLAVSSKSMVGATLIKRITRRWTDLRIGDLMAGMAGDKTVETALELFNLSRVPPAIRDVYLNSEIADVERALGDLPEGREFLLRLGHFLDTYGHRGTKDLDLGHPSWKEDHDYIHQMIRSYLQAGPEGWDPLRKFQDAVDRREAMATEIEKRLTAGTLSRIFPVRRWFFRRALRMVYEYFPWRENEKFYGVKIFPGTRRIMAEIGRRYTERGILEEPADVYFLSVPELERQEHEAFLSPDAIQNLVQDRKARWQVQRGQVAPFILRSDGRPVEDVGPPPTGDHLQGLAASGGRVTGIARVIREPSEGYRLGKGEILVAPATEPGWAPLFLLAGGLVMDVGGAVCHGAIVAREYGIPAVVGCCGATRMIQDGDRITVDGFAGEVIIHRTG